MIFLFVIGLLIASNIQQSAGANNIGLCYGTQGDNLPPPNEVVDLLIENKIQKVRLYSANQTVLDAFKGKNIEVMLGISNNDYQSIVANETTLDSWVKTNIKDYSPDVNITYVFVGYEISSVNGNQRWSFELLSAMQKIQNAISKAGLDVKVTTSFDMSILTDDSFPPSRGSFNSGVRDIQFLNPILEFLSTSGSPLHVNVYPYFSYITKRYYNVTLENALFMSNATVLVNDGKLEYKNAFYAMLDSLYSALEKVGYPSMEIVVSETGWPSAGGISASVENEEIYINNVIKYANYGTPKRPGKPIEMYLFAMFDEKISDGLGPGVEIEYHWGLFHSNKEMKFPFAINEDNTQGQNNGTNQGENNDTNQEQHESQDLGYALGGAGVGFGTIG